MFGNIKFIISTRTKLLIFPTATSLIHLFIIPSNINFIWKYHSHAIYLYPLDAFYKLTPSHRRDCVQEKILLIMYKFHTQFYVFLEEEKNYVIFRSKFIIIWFLQRNKGSEKFICCLTFCFMKHWKVMIYERERKENLFFIRTGRFFYL